MAVADSSQKTRKKKKYKFAREMNFNKILSHFSQPSTVAAILPFEKKKCMYIYKIMKP